MKLFPNKNIVVKLRNDRATTLNELRQNTKLTDTLISDYTDKGFIGKVDDSGFKIISSGIGHGAVCVFTGELQDSLGTIEIKLNNAFKVKFSILMVMPIIGFGITVLRNGIEESFGILIPMIFGILFIRFVFMELTFRIASTNGLKKLTNITGIKPVNINEVQQQV